MRIDDAPVSQEREEDPANGKTYEDERDQNDVDQAEAVSHEMSFRSERGSLKNEIPDPRLRRWPIMPRAPARGLTLAAGARH
jgi:hypothetical protein